MLAFWTVGAVALGMSTSMRLTTRQVDTPVVTTAEVEENVKLLTTTLLIHPMADLQEALRQPYLNLKDELGYWMNLKQPGIFGSDINIYNVKEIVNRLSPDDSRRFEVSWFLYNSDTELTEEKARSTTIKWRWTKLPWVKNPLNGTEMLATTFWVDNNLAKDVVIMTSHYQMLKDELVFWMRSLGKTLHRQDITIVKVEYDHWNYHVYTKYDVIWHLNFFNGLVTKEDAKQNCIWRRENTFDRHEMTGDLVTYFYFDGSYNENNVAIHPDTRDQQMKERLAAEFELRTTGIEIKNIEKQNWNDVNGGHQYRVGWAGRLPKVEANKMIEWGEQKKTILTTSVSIDPKADVQQALRPPYMMLKDELAYWLNMVENAGIIANDINIIGTEKIEGASTGGLNEFIITWFLYNSGGSVTKEMASSTKIQWRWTKLPWKNPPEGAQMLATTFWVENNLAKNVVMTPPYQMVKDELVFWMGSIGKKVRRHEIMITRVENDRWNFEVYNSKKYDITWYVLAPLPTVSKDDAKQRCIWRNENTFDRHEMAHGLTTTFYFSANSDYFNFVTKTIHTKKLEERLAAEFQLRANNITISHVDNIHMDIHGGHYLRVSWDGRLPQDEANVVIEWSKRNK